jgi:hypothetical protein
MPVGDPSRRVILTELQKTAARVPSRLMSQWKQLARRNEKKWGDDMEEWWEWAREVAERYWEDQVFDKWDYRDEGRNPQDPDILNDDALTDRSIYGEEMAIPMIDAILGKGQGAAAKKSYPW